MTTRTFALCALLAISGCAGPHFNAHAVANGALVGPGTQALAIVRVRAPWYAPRFVIARKFRASVPEYEHVAGLESKYFTISDDREFGGVYMWTARAAADAFYTEQWRRGIRARRGVDPDLLVLDAPFEIRGRATIDGDPIDARGLSFPATVTLVLAPEAGDPVAQAHALADAVKDLEGLIRGRAVIAPGRVGFVALWTSRDRAQAAVSTRGLHELGISGAAVTFFDAPVLIDASLRLHSSVEKTE
jgi:hypothetical protein